MTRQQTADNLLFIQRLEVLKDVHAELMIWYKTADNN